MSRSDYAKVALVLFLLASFWSCVSLAILRNKSRVSGPLSAHRDTDASKFLRFELQEKVLDS